MTYRVDGLLADGTVAFDPGTSLLVTGSAAASEDRLLDVVGDGVARDETAIVISATTSAAGIVAALRDRDALVPERVGVLDCTDSRGGETQGVPVAEVSSPGDLTGISLEFVKLLRRFEETGHAERVRVGLASISTLLIYTEVRTTFRFLHVFTSRISSAEMLGVFSIDPDMHDSQTVNTVRAIFDCEVHLGDDVDLRGTGFTIE